MLCRAPYHQASTPVALQPATINGNSASAKHGSLTKIGQVASLVSLTDKLQILHRITDNEKCQRKDLAPSNDDALQQVGRAGNGLYLVLADKTFDDRGIEVDSSHIGSISRKRAAE